MTYRAVVIIKGNTIAREFKTMSEAARWLDSQNNNFDATSVIETFDEAGNKKDGFFYSEKTR